MAAPARLSPATAARSSGALHYLENYSGHDYLSAVMADANMDHLDRQVEQLRAAGCDDLVLLPCIADRRQVMLLADALSDIGATNTASRAGRRASSTTRI